MCEIVISMLRKRVSARITVDDRETGILVEGAAVSVGSSRATTDAQGVAVISGLRKDEPYLCVVSHADYEDESKEFVATLP